MVKTNPKPEQGSGLQGKGLNIKNNKKYRKK